MEFRYDSHLFLKMVVPVVFVAIIPLYLLTKKLFPPNVVTNDIGKESGNDSYKENLEVNGNGNCKMAPKRIESDTTVATTRRSRIDTDCSFNSTLHTYSMDYNETPYDASLGRRRKEDESPVPTDCSTSSPPPDLAHVVVFQLPIGYYRLRKAMLDGQSSFWKDVVMEESLRYTRISQEEWSHHHQHIGNPTPPHPTANLTESDFLQSTRKSSYLMPDTAILKASIAHETATLTHYTPRAFTLTIQTLTPSVPFGSKFVNHTQITVTNTHTTQGGKTDTCRLTCSCEVEFPNGPPPMVGSQIRKHSRIGSIGAFHKIEEAIRTAIEVEGETCSNHSDGDAGSFVYDLSLPGVRKVDESKPSFFFTGGNGLLELDEGSTVIRRKKLAALMRMRRWSLQKGFMSKSKREKRKNKKLKNKERRKRSDTDFSEITNTLFA